MSYCARRHVGAKRRACRAARVVVRKSGGTLHLADDRKKRAVGVLRGRWRPRLNSAIHRPMRTTLSGRC
jgi:hypothetical protein